MYHELSREKILLSCELHCWHDSLHDYNTDISQNT